MKPLILITNDDSIDAKGIHHLVDCVKEMGEVYVVAPTSRIPDNRRPSPPTSLCG